MSEDILRIMIPAIIALLILLLIYRIKAQIRRMIKNEVYDNFPSVKHAIEDFTKRIDYLNAKLSTLEHKIEEWHKKRSV